MSNLDVNIDYVKAKDSIKTFREALFYLDAMIDNFKLQLEQMDDYLKNLEGILDNAVFKEPHKSDQGAWPNG